MSDRDDARDDAQIVYLCGTGPTTDAARYLVEHTALRHCTATLPDASWMGAKAVRVELTTRHPSPEENFLWHVVRDLAYGDNVDIDFVQAGSVTDGDREELAEALSIALTATVDVEPALGGVSA